jgi:hypothetical protein
MVLRRGLRVCELRLRRPGKGTPFCRTGRVKTATTKSGDVKAAMTEAAPEAPKAPVEATKTGGGRESVLGSSASAVYPAVDHAIDPAVDHAVDPAGDS